MDYNTKTFIDKANIIHENKYDYSKTLYVNGKNKIIITCKYHGDFESWPMAHMHRKIGCPYCSKKKIKKEELIKNFKSLNTGYDYSKFEYVNSTTKSIIICPKHGEFKQSYANHFHLKQKCPKCFIEKQSKFLSWNTDVFIEKAKEIHGDEYDYSLSSYILYNKKLNIICPKHGVFPQSPNSHLRGEGCPGCCKSKGEKQIEIYLKKNNIPFLHQHYFDDCKNKRFLYFDFYIPSKNLCIEYNGEQHYKPVKYFGGDVGYDYMKNNDNIKQDYCENNNIKLLIIKFDEFDNIKQILNKNIL